MTFQLKNIAPKRPDLVKKLIETELKPWLKKAGDDWAIDFERDVKPILNVPWTHPGNAKKSKNPKPSKPKK